MTFKYTAQYYELQSPCCTLHPQDLFYNWTFIILTTFTLLAHTQSHPLLQAPICPLSMSLIFWAQRWEYLWGLSEPAPQIRCQLEPGLMPLLCTLYPRPFWAGLMPSFLACHPCQRITLPFVFFGSWKLWGLQEKRKGEFLHWVQCIMVIKAGVLHPDAGASPEVLEHAGSDVFFSWE